MYYNNLMAKKYEGETIGGRPVTDELIAKAVERAERGYDVEKLRKRGRPKLNPDTDGQSTVIPVRMDDELLEALREKARQGGISRSEAIREAVRAWTHVA